MIAAYPVAEVRAAEAALMATLLPGTLMQRAAAGLAAVCADVLGGPYGARVVLLVGTGDNGGDTLYAGARLARRGARVDALLLGGERTHAGGLAAFRRAGGHVIDDPEDLPGLAAMAHLALDGIVGIGGKPGLRPDAATALQTVTEAGPVIVAVDVPSGIDVDSGEAPASHVRAHVTVTFGTAKIGLLVDPGAEAAGVLHIIDIGLRPYLPKPAVEALEATDVAARLPHSERQSHKYSRGVVGVLAGSANYAGAAVLCVGGAIRGGAGMVRFVGPEGAAALVRNHWPEAVAARGRVQSWVLGPGLGSGEGVEQQVAEVFRERLPVVVDADALRYLPKPYNGPALLTPHAGEVARLLDVEREEVEAKRLSYARTAAEKFGATVLLKGSTTVVAAPDGRVRVNRTGTPALATAGSGDVLAGLAGALLAGGLDPLEAGSVAAYIHGLAGTEAARTSGSPSSQDILAALPMTLRECAT
jgi:ADP-dependent NAD(P)H-hydrate dehydratase / NAD(P)H-hydrate epimerase